MTNTVKEQLSAFLDGELPEAETTLLLKRLERDDELKGTLSRYSLTAGDRELYATARAGERLWAGALFSLP